MSFGGGAGVTAEQKYKTMKVERITTDEGEARAIVFGKVRGIVGQLIWAGKIRQEWQYAGDVEVGKDSEETYKQVPFRHYAIGICEAEGNVELSKIWRNNKLVYDASNPAWPQNARFMNKTTFYNGAYAQLPNATMEAALGAGNVPAFRGTAYMVRRNINLEAFQGAVPQYVFEVDATYIPPAPSGSADLKMTVEAAPDEVMVGDTITVTYTVENLGVDDSESAVVNFSSNPELSMVSSTLSKGSLAGGVWTISDIANGTSETAEIVYEATGDGIITVGATVSAATPDPDPLNNYDFHTVEIAVGYDPDAQAIIDMLTTPISAAQKARLSGAIEILKGSNPWSLNTWMRRDVLAFGLQSSETQELSLIDWKRKHKMTVVGGLVWGGADGWLKSGSVERSYIETSYNPFYDAVAMTTSDCAHGGRYTTIPVGIGPQRHLSNLASNFTMYQQATGNIVSRLQSNTGLISGVSDRPSPGDFYHITRSGNSVNVIKNTAVANTGTSTAGSTLPNATLKILGVDTSDTTAGDIYGEGAYHVGAALLPNEDAVLKMAHDFYIN